MKLPPLRTFLTHTLPLILLTGLGIAGFYYLGHDHYLLFHSFAELFSIGVCYSLLILAWNTRRFHQNSFLLFVALALVFASNIDLVHTLSYKGMNLFPLPNSANVPTQLWIAARYMQALALLVAPFFYRRKVPTESMIAGLASIELLIFASIFWWKIFPICYIDGIGQTPFKIISEYIIIGIYAAGLLHFSMRREWLHPRVYVYMVAMLVVSIATEAAFTTYIGVYDFANWVGHFLKILSYYLVYKAIVDTGLNQPVELLFHNLQQSQAALEKSHMELENRVIERTALLQAQVAERIKAEEQVIAQAVRSKALAEISRLSIAAVPGGKTPLDTIAATLVDCPGNGVLIRLLTDDHCFLDAVVIRHSDPEIQRQMQDLFRDITVVPGRDLIGRIFTDGHAIIYPEYPLDKFQESYGEQAALQFKQLGFHSVISAPMHIRNEKIGSIAVLRDRQHPPYTQDDRALMESVANRVALSVSNERLYASLQKSLAQEQNMRDRLIQSEKHSAISRMIASIAHELNNPVQTIQNCLYLFKQHTKTDNPNLEQYISMATKETERISNLVSQLREVYRPRRERPRDVITIDSILGEVHQLLEPHLAHNHVEWVDLCDCASSDSVFRISALPDQLKQVFLNLCLNAIEAMQPAGGVLYFDKQLSSDRKMVGVSIQDTGSGIASENLPKIFDPFFTTKDSGTGLGLAISFDIVVRHGGSLLVDSQPGRGAKFTVWLPLAEELEPASPENRLSN